MAAGDLLPPAHQTVLDPATQRIARGPGVADVGLDHRRAEARDQHVRAHVGQADPLALDAPARGQTTTYVYDKLSNDEGLYDTVLDPMEKTDLLASRTSTEKASWHSIRQAGRALNVYFKERWDKKCLTETEC